MPGAAAVGHRLTDADTHADTDTDANTDTDAHADADSHGGAWYLRAGQPDL